jgi:hypothetical protein
MASQNVRLQRSVRIMRPSSVETRVYDLVVLGSGPSGLAAAVAASRRGLRTALIEKDGVVGGTLNAGLNLHGFEDMNGRRVVGGVAWELIQRCIANGGSVGPVRLVNSHMYSTTPVDMWVMQKCALEMLLEAGVHLSLHTLATEPLVETGRLIGVDTWSKSGRIVFKGDTFVDATGDADIAYRAGVSAQTGRPKDQGTQPMSLGMTMSPVDLDPMMDSIGLGYGKAIKPYCEKEDYAWFALDFSAWKKELIEIGLELGFKGVCWGNSIRPRIANLNAVKVVGKNGADTQELTQAEIQSRLTAIRFSEFLRNTIPGFSNAFIVRISHFIGIRETRHMVGQYVLTKEDVVSGTIPDDVVTLCGYPIDVHDPKDGAAIFTDSAGGRFGIPYRCLLPREVSNLLVAGRAISASHEALGATRVMGTCLALGEACGTAAALAREKQLEVTKLAGTELRQELEANKIMLL